MCSSIIFSVVIAWIQIVITAVGSIQVAILLFTIKTYESIYIGYIGRVYWSDIYSLGLSFCLTGLLASLLLMIGLHKKSKLLAIPWLCSTMICIICFSGGIITFELFPALLISGLWVAIWLIVLNAVNRFEVDQEPVNNAQICPMVSSEVLTSP